MAAQTFGIDLTTIDRTVYVTNVAPTASIEKLTEFFGFCGKINSLRLRKSADGTQEALIEFDAPSAAKTALMLKDALIEGIPICVVPLSQESFPHGLENESSASVEEANLEGQRYAEESGEQERTSTSVVASLLGSGYILGNNAFQSAVQYDQQNQISVKAQEMIQTVQVTASQYDEKYGVSTSVSNLWEQSKAMAKPYVDQTTAMAMPYVDQTSAAAAPYIETAKVTTTNAVNNAMENPSVRSAMESVSTSMVNLKDQTKTDIERRQQEQGLQAGAGAGAGEAADQENPARPQEGQQGGWEGDQVVIRDDEDVL